MLKRHAVLAEADFETTREVHAMRGITMDLPRGADANSFQGYIAQVMTPEISLHAVGYSTDVTLRVPPQVDDYVIPVQTRANRAGGFELLDMTTAIASPDQEDRMQVSGGVLVMGAILPRASIELYAQHLFGDDLKGAVAFRFDDTSGQRGMRAVGTLIKVLIEEEADTPHILLDPRRMSAFRDSLISAMLLFCPHSSSGLLSRPSAAPAPRDVRRVVDFIRAHSERALSLADLVAEAGVPGRTLNDHFRSFTGLSPMAYLKRARLRHAHDLMQAGRVVSVTDAAYEAGFTHLGRFARDYRAMFAEPPSNTLRKGRRH